MFLCEFLLAPKEERVTQLESYPFFNREAMSSGRYAINNVDIIRIIEQFCKATDKEPKAEYFRVMRREFCARLIDNGVNGRASRDNALKQALAHAGGDFDDKRDMVIALSEWRAVADKFKEETQAWGDVPVWRHTDQSLMTEPACRTVMHRHQTMERVLVIRNEALLREAMALMDGEMVVYMVDNHHPRKFSDLPELIAFKPIGRVMRKVAVVQPHLVDDALLFKVWQYAARFPLLTMPPK